MLKKKREKIKVRHDETKKVFLQTTRTTNSICYSFIYVYMVFQFSFFCSKFQMELTAIQTFEFYLLCILIHASSKFGARVLHNY